MDDESTLAQVMACCWQQQAITWAYVDPDLSGHMAWLRHNELTQGMLNFSEKNPEIYLYFTWFLDMGMSQVVEINSQERHDYPYCTQPLTHCWWPGNAWSQGNSSYGLYWPSCPVIFWFQSMCWMESRTNQTGFTNQDCLFHWQVCTSTEGLNFDLSSIRE